MTSWFVGHGLAVASRKVILRLVHRERIVNDRDRAGYTHASPLENLFPEFAVAALASTIQAVVLDGETPPMGE